MKNVSSFVLSLLVSTSLLASSEVGEFCLNANFEIGSVTVILNTKH